MSEEDEICPVCERPLNDCICCESCGHSCPRDHGESYCPVCLPDPAAS